ncbi:hypothetical protein EAE96_008257 [Botrytis aclada]|nr:hypothetical protein EAE96_008257 [Botrytis aclada]
MDSGDIDRGPRDDRMFPNDEVLQDRQNCDDDDDDDDRRNERSRSIAKESSDLEVQKAEFKKLREEHKKQVQEFAESQVEYQDKLRTFNEMEKENARKLDVLRAEQCKFNTAVTEFNTSLQKAREAKECFNKEVETWRGKFRAAKQREKSFLREYYYKQRYLAERERRIDRKLKYLRKVENFFDPDRESYEYLQSIVSQLEKERKGSGDFTPAEEDASVSGVGSGDSMEAGEDAPVSGEE